MRVGITIGCYRIDDETSRIRASDEVDSKWYQRKAGEERAETTTGKIEWIRIRIHNIKPWHFSIRWYEEIQYKRKKEDSQIRVSDNIVLEYDFDSILLVLIYFQNVSPARSTRLCNTYQGSIHKRVWLQSVHFRIRPYRSVRRRLLAVHRNRILHRRRLKNDYYFRTDQHPILSILKRNRERRWQIRPDLVQL